MLAYVGGVKRRMIRKSDGGKARRKALPWSKSALAKRPRASPAADESAMQAEGSAPPKDEAATARKPRSQNQSSQTAFECLRSFDTSFLLGLVASEQE
mmetsp:Transcript_10493/g.26954  ORF Transcript_10493/g.26954 Transcript_10493/m.26954 type:complete len:98 (-) Transcript_10493:139-432(-)